MDALTIAAGIAAGLFLALVARRFGVGPGPGLALCGLGGAAASAGVAGAARGPGAPVATLALLLTAPLLYRAGLLLGNRVVAIGVRRAALHLVIGASRTVARVFLVGGIAFVAIPWPAESALDPRRTAFLLAVAWSIPELFHGMVAAEDAVAHDERADHQTLWSLVVTLAMLAALGVWTAVDRSPLPRPGGAGAYLGGLAIAVVAGVASGLAATIATRSTRSRSARQVVHLAAPMLAVAIATWLSGFALLAALVAGMLHGASTRRTLDPGSPDWLGGALDTGWDALGLVAAAAVVVMLGASAPALLDPSHAGVLGRVALVWAAATAVQLLLASITAPLSPGARGSRPIGGAALSAWTFYPGPLAVGCLLGSGVLPSSTQLASGELHPSAMVAAFVFLALIVQGGLAGRLLRRRTGGARGSAWQRLEGQWIALRAALDSARRLRDDGRVPDGMAETLVGSLEGELAAVELERQERVASDPALEQTRWTLAVRTVLSDARGAIERASGEGMISEEVAERLCGELARKLDRAEVERVRELFRE